MHVSDIVFWTTSDEKDWRFQKRQDILRTTDLILRHVLEDQGCERVVIVGHSLGSAIAYETLLHLGRARIARSGRIDMPMSLGSLDKITDFIPLGSPSEIIASLFEMEPSKYHRDNRVAEDRRGCTDDVPFLGGRGVRWVNVSDPADLISRPIYSVRGRLPNRLAIYKWKTASGHVSMLLSAHSGYFHSKDALNLLFSVCINRESASRGGWRSAPAISRFLRRRGAVIARTLIAAAAWLLAVDLLARTTNYSAVSAWAGAGASALVGGLAALVALGWWADRRWPIKRGAGVDKSDIHGL